MFKKLIEKLYLSMEGNLVYYDEITKCKSRYFYDNVIKEKYSNKKCYIIFVDMNGLKKINDEQGHHYGTKLIKQVATQLLSLERVKDVCRFGGDEFVLIASEGFNIKQLENIDHISYGIYLKNEWEDMVSACKFADEKMYIMKNRIKKEGRV